MAWKLEEPSTIYMTQDNVLKYLGVGRSMLPKYIAKGKLTPVPLRTPLRKLNPTTIIYITAEVVALKKEIIWTGSKFGKRKPRGRSKGSTSGTGKDVSDLRGEAAGA